MKITKNDARAVIKEEGHTCTVEQMHTALKQADRNKCKRVELERLNSGLCAQFMGIK